MELLEGTEVRRLTDCPELPRMLMFKLTENLAAGAGPYTITDAVRGWTVDEEGGYNPETLSGLHFSQVVWKNTAELGCANNICPPDGTFPVEYGVRTLPSAFVRWSDSWMLYRTIHSSRASITHPAMLSVNSSAPPVPI